MCIYCASVVPNTWITIDQSIAEAMLVDHVIFKNASDKSLPVFIPLLYRFCMSNRYTKCGQSVAVVKFSMPIHDT